MNITNIVNEVANSVSRKVTEDNEKFIFETISPFCDSIEQTVISKRELVDVIVKSRPQKIRFKNGEECCPSCNVKLGTYSRGRIELYCIECGQKIDRKW